MNRIAQKFEQLKNCHAQAFIAYVMAGDPDINTTQEIILALELCATDIIEIGIPFSDPLADGPIIQAAGQRALCNGVNIDKVFRMVRGIRKKSSIPLVAMTYYNLIFRYGAANFARDAQNAGFDGLIVPDLPPEEAKELIAACRLYKLCLIFLLAPTSTVERIKAVTAVSEGFIYYVSVTGVTGMRNEISSGVSASIKAIKKYTSLPVCVGFGISNTRQLKAIKNIADGVIVGSALVDIIAKYEQPEERLLQLKSYVEKMIKELKK